MDDERLALINAHEKAEELQKRQFAEDVRDSLYDLDKYVLGYSLMEEHVHKELCLFVESLICDPQPRLEKLLQFKAKNPEFVPPEGVQLRDAEIFRDTYSMQELHKRFRLILMPRGSFKTSVVTIGFPLQLLLHNPNLRILIDSEVFDKSCAFNSELRGHLESNHVYREVFKTFYGVYPDANKNHDAWTNSAMNIAAKTRKTKEPSISAAGIGATKVGMHYDVIIADDLQSEKNTTSKEIIEQVINHYKFLLSLLEPGGILIVIGTRWDYQDVYQYILDRERKRFGVFARQAIKPDGSLLFPERLTQEFIQLTKESQGSYIFSCQYQNLPVDDESAKFKHSQMRRVDEDYIKGRPINWFMMVDPAISMDKNADNTAFVIAGYDENRNIYVKHITKGKFTPSELVDKVFELYEYYKPRSISIEAVAYQKTLIYAIMEKQQERGWWLPIKETKRASSRSKEDRILALQPFYEYGHVFHLNNCANIDDMEHELLHFPKGQHDDIIDALADLLEIGYPPGKSHGRNEDDESESREERRKRLKRLTIPRSNITRY